ncbi:MAG: hypothetical protein GWN58_36735, partial [Anaerolineae bacterium]|nr:hypothetical protein [Anaerolineae bacterium]
MSNTKSRQVHEWLGELTTKLQEAQYYSALIASWSGHVAGGQYRNEEELTELNTDLEDLLQRAKDETANLRTEIYRPKGNNHAVESEKKVPGSP